MNSVSISWIASARRASLAALILVAAACDNGNGGSATDTNDTTTDGTNATTTNTTTNEPTTADATDTEDGTATTDDTAAPTTGPVAVDYETDIQPIWDANCTTGCHVAGGSASGWFVITPGDSHANLVGKQSIELASMQLVAPSDRDASYLWHKINNTHVEAGGNGTAMPPPPAAALTADDLDKIGAWIDAGAPE